MKALGIIPARFGSSRFPGKPLAKIGEKTMIEWVYKRASKANFEMLYVATDDIRIHKKVIDFGGMSILTSNKHRTGTERTAEAVQKINGNFDVVVNIQGDEPFIEAEQLNILIKTFEDKEVEISTLIQHCNDTKQLLSPNTIKVVKNLKDYGIYFSRSLIPYIRDKEENWSYKYQYFKHIGIYAYRTEVLKNIVKLPPHNIEIAESLEQLRWIANGYKIKVTKSEYKGLAVDTPEDLEKIIQIYKKGLF